MMEIMKDDPIIEHKIEVSNNYSSCIYCGINNIDVLVQCGNCEHKFCNGISDLISESHILYHMKKSNHKTILYPKNKINEELYFDDQTMEIISCGYCKVSSIFELYFYKDIEKKKIEFLCEFHYNKKLEEAKEEEKKEIKSKFNKMITCIDNDKKNKTYFIDSVFAKIPDSLEDLNLLDDCDFEMVRKNEDIIQLTDPITQRFLNKVKDRYESSEEYYEIYKPLIYSEYNYVKRIYDSKQEYPIELYYSDHEKEKYLYFEISKDFNGINLGLGKRIQLSEEPKQIEQLLNITNDEGNQRGAPINFTAAIMNIIPNRNENNKKIVIIPITNDINTIKNNLGVYIMRENFCEVPYYRMLNGLDSFNDEKKSHTSNLIHSQILGIMEENLIKEMDEKEMKNLFNENEFITKIDIFGELNTHQVKCMKKVFSHSLNMIQGPPGTGKSYLASFIIYNIFKKRLDENDKILVCTPSNSAADNLASYLLNLNNSLTIKENLNENDTENKNNNKNNLDKSKEKKDKNRKMKILRVYPKVKELLEINKNLIEISFHNKLNYAIEEYKEMKKKMISHEEEEIEDDEILEEKKLKEENKSFSNFDDSIIKNISYKNNEIENISQNINENLKKNNKNKKGKNINIELSAQKIKNISDNIINEHDIIITTCSTSYDSKLIDIDFIYVLVDEATQCCEVECLLPIVHGSRHVTLIGDQKQLGPTIIYPKANLVGMNISLFERMIKIYPDNYIMLKKQYRMKSELAKFPSDFFYEGKIKTSSKHKENKYASKILKKFFWPKKDIPIIFINTNNKTTEKYNLTDKEKIIKKNIDNKINNNANNFTSEKNIGKSYENELEAEITVKIINELKSIKSYKKGKYDIGIITPYTGQKKLILEKLYYYNDSDSDNDFDYFNSNIINIASVDSFQGKEKDFIIINTVRSNYKNYIGFLKDPRRLNVSLTRAKHGLIIIGDAHCLSNACGEKDNKYCIWRYLIQFYQEMGLIVDYNEGKKGDKMFSPTQILKNGEKLEEYKFQEYDYDGKFNRHNINIDYINDYGYIKKKQFFHFIDDRQFCIDNSLFYEDESFFDDYYSDFYDEELDNNNDYNKGNNYNINNNNNYDYYNEHYNGYNNMNENNKDNYFDRNNNINYYNYFNYNKYRDEISKNNNDYNDDQYNIINNYYPNYQYNNNYSNNYYPNNNYENDFFYRRNYYY